MGLSISHGPVVDLRRLSGFGETATEVLNIRSTCSQLNVEAKGLVWKLNTFRVRNVHSYGCRKESAVAQKLPFWSRLKKIKLHGIYFATTAGERALTTAKWLENRLL